MLRKYGPVAIDTTSGGAATVYLGDKINGRVEMMFFDKGTLANAYDVVVTGETTLVPILTSTDMSTADRWVWPRALVNSHDDGVIATDDHARIWVQEERIKVVVANGGDTVSGAVTVWVDEE